MFLKNQWYTVAWAEEVGRELLARTVCDERIILFRQQDGTPVVLEDRCCHRLLPLSVGRVVGDVVQCGYHGLEFDRSGACVKVPGQTAIPPGSSIRAYPVVERYAFLWVWLGAAEAADEAQIPVLERLVDPAWTGKTGNHLHIHCDYEVLNDNLMDLSHESYVHNTSIGNDAVAEEAHIKTTRDDHCVRVERWMLDHEPAPFWKKIMADTGYVGNVDRWQQIRFVPPCNYVLHVGVAPAGSGAPEGDKSKGVECCVVSINTPETEKSCYQFWTFYRNFQLDSEALTEQMTGAVHNILTEDIAILNAQQEAIDANPGMALVDINHDAGGLQARRLLDDWREREQRETTQQAAE